MEPETTPEASSTCENRGTSHFKRSKFRFSQLGLRTARVLYRLEERQVVHVEKAKVIHK